MTEPSPASPPEPDRSATPALAMSAMPDGVKIMVPKPVRNLTTYVLREQGDWFEDEVKFLRRYLQPGMQVVDIGANYGVYTLSMAKAVGGNGRVWAFEPASETARVLTSSISLNRFDNITLITSGVSDRLGEASFNLAASSELNSLGPVRNSTGSETIQLTTFDHWAATTRPSRLDFIKLDAEGEESRIIDGARKTLGNLSPLVMFELKHAKQVNLPLIMRFAELGFSTYRLIPGIGKLVPFDPSTEFDPYLLNLFACKEDLAYALSANGVLVRREEEANLFPAEFDHALKSQLAEVNGIAHDTIRALPFASKFHDTASWNPGTGGEFEQMLDCYLAAKQMRRSAAQRWQLMRLASRISSRLTKNGAGSSRCSIEQAATHARIARDAGEQNRAVQILLQAIRSNTGVTNLKLIPPFLPAVPRYDRLNPGRRLNHWLISSVIEQYVRDHAYSTYFTARKALPALQRLESMGFISQGMRRRLALVSSLNLKE